MAGRTIVTKSLLDALVDCLLRADECDSHLRSGLGDYYRGLIEGEAIGWRAAVSKLSTRFDLDIDSVFRRDEKSE